MHENGEQGILVSLSGNILATLTPPGFCMLARAGLGHKKALQHVCACHAPV